MSEVVSAHRLCNNPELYEPQRNNCFRFIVTDIDNIIKAGINTTLGADAISNTDRIADAQDTLELAVMRSSVPTFTQNPITIRRGNSVMKAAGTPEFQNGTIAIRDFVGKSGRSVLQAWKALSYNVKADTVGYMKDYKKTCYLLEYNLDFSKVITTYKLHGCWISDLQIPEFDNSQDSSNERQITATIQYDYAEIEE